MIHQLLAWVGVEPAIAAAGFFYGSIATAFIIVAYEVLADPGDRND